MVARSFLALGVDAIQEGRARLTHNGACERSMHASFRILLFGLGCKDTSYPSPKPLTFAGSTFSALCCCSFFFSFFEIAAIGDGRYSGLGMDAPGMGCSRPRPRTSFWFGDG